MEAGEREPGTAGGRRLRAIRRAAGRTQLWVEAESELGTGYLQRVESGRVVQPERGTLERILNALDARYSERREVLELFGYAVSTPPPDDADITWARATCHDELHAVPFPAIVLDCTHRLLAWNRLVPRLFGILPDDPTFGRLAGRSYITAWFDPSSPIPPHVAEPDALLPAILRAFQYEMRQFGHEPWYAGIMAELRALPAFQHYWRVTEQTPPPVGAARALVPLRLSVPGSGTLEFRLASEPFVRDARFRMVFYVPGDLVTMQWCAEWSGFGNRDSGQGSIVPSS
ncbi:MAG TPA: helix-turn-helix domain-containing protein [Thermomicrobiales bacterium]|nr:helix-turn-helix domain-containing protein [Thermomicrobiales bacterium]